ncbi:hypothetical protein M1247_14865 [Mycobacterium sp. 21AC1]|uniref:hypothetical protein n=1 Tax=[Mycobacterium] appelbergii TaxID=2939269 RepID=UPI00293937CE|nr:hypothetical protein [Mycobacterium sp. 21AC1]MDV3126202.1 hypothetical protein [Mycobacterium sp. 21AC1]
MSRTANSGAAGAPRFHLFDIRNIIGALLGIYGAVLLVSGLVPAILADHHDGPADNRVDLYIGTDANWWVGLCLLVVAATFFVWAYLRPVAVVESAGQGEPDG